MLPCSRFGGRQQVQSSEESQTSVVGENYVVKSENEMKSGFAPDGEAPAVNRRRRQRDLRASSPTSP